MVKFADSLRLVALNEPDEDIRGWKRAMLDASRRGEQKHELYAHSKEELNKLRDFLKKEEIKFVEERNKGLGWSMEFGAMKWDCIVVTTSW